MKNFREREELSVKLNVYDLVWDRANNKGQNAGLADLGFGFYHTGLTSLSIASLPLHLAEVDIGFYCRLRNEYSPQCIAD